MTYDVRNIDKELEACDLSFKEQCKIIYEGLKRGAVFDGCTGAPDFNFAVCCAEHDCYYQGKAGEKVSRAEADRRLRDCILKKGIPSKIGPINYNTNWFLAGVYYAAVRLFGWKFWRADKTTDS
jgi:hypothetical protein